MQEAKSAFVCSSAAFYTKIKKTVNNDVDLSLCICQEVVLENV